VPLQLYQNIGVEIALDLADFLSERTRTRHQREMLRYR
jgi:hypothetical protein